MAGTAVFRIVVSSDSMKNATATSHGKSRLVEILGTGENAVLEGELMKGEGEAERDRFAIPIKSWRRRGSAGQATSCNRCAS